MSQRKYNPGQDIFNFKQRTYDDAIKRPINFGIDEENIEHRIAEEGEKNNQQFVKYIETQYAIFQQKIINCKLKCVQKANNYNDIKKCHSSCEGGVKTFRRFVDEKITQMQTYMNQCVSNANQLPNILHETYYCYQLYNRGFTQLKNVIREQSLFYQ